MAIIDTGAGVNAISHTFLTKIRYEIQEPTKEQFIMANGTKSTPLGIVRKVPIKFGPVTIFADMIVVA